MNKTHLAIVLLSLFAITYVNSQSTQKAPTLGTYNNAFNQIQLARYKIGQQIIALVKLRIRLSLDSIRDLSTAKKNECYNACLKVLDKCDPTAQDIDAVIRLIVKNALGNCRVGNKVIIVVDTALRDLLLILIKVFFGHGHGHSDDSTDEEPTTCTNATGNGQAGSANCPNVYGSDTCQTYPDTDGCGLRLVGADGCAVEYFSLDPYDPNNNKTGNANFYAIGIFGSVGCTCHFKVTTGQNNTGTCLLVDIFLDYSATENDFYYCLENDLNAQAKYYSVTCEPRDL